MFLDVHQTFTTVAALCTFESFLLIVHKHVSVQDLFEARTEPTHHAHMLFKRMYLLVHVPFAHRPKVFAAEIAWNRLRLRVDKKMSL